MDNQSEQDYKQEVWKIPNFMSQITPKKSVINHTFSIKDEDGGQSIEVKMALFMDKSEALLLKTSMESDEDDYDSVNFRILEIEFFESDGTSVSYDKCQIDEKNPHRPYDQVDLCEYDHVADTKLSFGALRNRLFTLTREDVITIRVTFICSIIKALEDTDNQTQIKSTVGNYGSQVVLKDFESILNDSASADIVIKTTLGTPKCFSCHRNILKARSSIFRAMLEVPMKEKNDNEIVIPDVSSETMEHFLSFLYSGRFQSDTWIQRIPSLTYVAEKYCMASLKNLCDRNLIRIVTCSNALAMGYVAQRFELSKAVDDIKKFIAKNSGQLNLDFTATLNELEIGD